MFYESIIGVCVLLYLLWKFLLPGKREQIELEEPNEKQDLKEKQTFTPLQNTFNASKKIQDDIKISTYHVKENIIKTIEEEVTFRNKAIIAGNKYESSFNPFVVHENNKNAEDNFMKNISKRESPPKEKFAEFIEKTLCDNKIQSIMQNLSLDSELFKYDEPNKENIKDIEHEFKPLIAENNISEKAVKLQKSIDEIADKIKLLNDTNIIKDSKPANQCVVLPSAIKARQAKFDSESVEQFAENKTDDNKLLKRMQKQSGMPMGLNFGSLIGELKNKTKNASNGNLKPVFKKFDIDYDAVDDAKVKLLATWKNINHSHISKCIVLITGNLL